MYMYLLVSGTHFKEECTLAEIVMTKCIPFVSCYAVLDDLQVKIFLSQATVRLDFVDLPDQVRVGRHAEFLKRAALYAGVWKGTPKLEHGASAKHN